MKKVPLKITDMGENGEINYADNMIQALRSPTGQGIDYDEMRQVLPVIAKVEKAKTGDCSYVLLEDAEHKLLADRIKKAKYGMAVQEVFDMIDEIVNAPDYDMRLGEVE